MHILRADNYRSMPWKNGGGVTTEIAVSPEGAGLADFDWRVSMAQVASSGPFSQFPGIDRTLAILEGAGMVLHLADSEPAKLTAHSDPFAFPADVPTSAELIDGAVIDLNVMTRRGRWRHSIERVAIVSPTDIPMDKGSTLVLCASGSVSVGDGAQEATLGPRDTLLAGPGTAVLRLRPTQPTILFVIRIGSAERGVAI